MIFAAFSMCSFQPTLVASQPSRLRRDCPSCNARCPNVPQVCLRSPPTLPASRVHGFTVIALWAKRDVPILRDHRISLRFAPFASNTGEKCGLDLPFSFFVHFRAFLWLLFLWLFAGSSIWMVTVYSSSPVSLRSTRLPGPSQTLTSSRVPPRSPRGFRRAPARNRATLSAVGEGCAISGWRLRSLPRSGSTPSPCTACTPWARPWTSTRGR